MMFIEVNSYLSGNFDVLIRRMSLQLHTPVEIRHKLAARLRSLRLARGWKQSTLASRAAVSVSTVQRYEQTGKTSLENLLRICQALGRLDEFEQLLRPARANSMAELERLTSDPPPRGRGNK
jgi:DNA-binding Xre family transcriptional regulator